MREEKGREDEEVEDTRQQRDSARRNGSKLAMHSWPLA